MSLNWKWDEKCGEATLFECYPNDEPRTFKLDLYVGNAYLIFIYEFNEDGQDRYSLNGFFADKTHMNRLLGIDKRYKETYGDNIYEKQYSKLTKIRLNKAKCKHVDEIVSAFVKAFNNIEIEIYTEE